MTLQVKVELLDKDHGSRSVAAVTCHLPFQDKWNQHKVYCLKKNNKREREEIKKEKEICEATKAATSADEKTLQFLQDIFLSHIKNPTFMWAQDCYKKGLPID